MKIGIDWGGTKIEIIALSDAGEELFRKRIATPRDDYQGCLNAVRDLVQAAEQATGQTGTVGLGIPGSLSPKTGLVKNANSQWINGKPLDKDLEACLNRPVRIENDANCLAVSEATDGAGAGAAVVHAIIIGTGCGSGIAINGKALKGANGIAGEWGAISQPWRREDEFPGLESWTGHSAAIDICCSGTGFQQSYKDLVGQPLSGHEIIALMRQGDEQASRIYKTYLSALARSMAMLANILDPDVFVLGGGMSNVNELYDDLLPAMQPFIMSDVYDVPIRKAKHGDSSGVRGAAWLWNDK